MNYSYQSVGNGTIVANYFEKGMERPYNYVINIVDKSNPSVGDTFDFVIKETNVNVQKTFSQWQIVEAIANGKNNDGMMDLLVPNTLLIQSDQPLYEGFIGSNMDYFDTKLKYYGVGFEKIFTVLDIDIKIAFVELMRNIYKDMVTNNYETMK